MNCFKKRAMFITAGFLGIGGYILYFLKNKIRFAQKHYFYIPELYN